jgi:hypothetical protein
MKYFPWMLDKIRLHARDELPEDYHANLGAARAADGMCCNFLVSFGMALSRNSGGVTSPRRRSSG